MKTLETIVNSPGSFFSKQDVIYQMSMLVKEIISVTHEDMEKLERSSLYEDITRFIRNEVYLDDEVEISLGHDNRIEVSVNTEPLVDSFVDFVKGYEDSFNEENIKYLEYVLGKLEETQNSLK